MKKVGSFVGDWLYMLSVHWYVQVAPSGCGSQSAAEAWDTPASAAPTTASSVESRRTADRVARGLI